MRSRHGRRRVRLAAPLSRAVGGEVCAQWLVSGTRRRAGAALRARSGPRLSSQLRSTRITPRLEVDVRPPKRPQLSPSKPRVKGRRPERAVALGQRLDQRTRLGRAGDPLAPSPGRRAAQARASGSRAPRSARAPAGRSPAAAGPCCARSREKGPRPPSGRRGPGSCCGSPRKGAGGRAPATPSAAAPARRPEAPRACRARRSGCGLRLPWRRASQRLSGLGERRAGRRAHRAELQGRLCLRAPGPRVGERAEGLADRLSVARRPDLGLVGRAGSCTRAPTRLAQ